MKNIKIDFIIHWLWVVVFGLLLTSGLTLMGAKFGWIMNYQVALADYLHRTLAALWLILTFAAMITETVRINSSSNYPMPWLVTKKSIMGIYVILITLLFAISGTFLWLCMEFSHKVLAFALVTHDLLTLVSTAVIIWHIYDKAHGLPREFGVKKNV